MAASNTDAQSEKKRSSARILARPVSEALGPCLSQERSRWHGEHRFVAGIDEAGRGPWAGPVVAAAVILEPDTVPSGLADSKALTAGTRDALFEEIMAKAHVGIGIADVGRIDRGNQAPLIDCPVTTIVKGDALSISIAAASIVAKVTRDRMMEELDADYPGYGFAQHKGYGTPQHRSAIARLGPTPAHRRSFKPVREALKAAGAGPEASSHVAAKTDSSSKLLE